MIRGIIEKNIGGTIDGGYRKGYRPRVTRKI